MLDNLHYFDGTSPMHRAWLEISPGVIESNVKEIKKRLGKECLLMAVVKADGYGHGAETVSRAAIKGGANYLGVATLFEGVQIRKADINVPILILGNLITREELNSCFEWNLMPTLCSLSEAKICNEIAHKGNNKFRAHVKFDTGMTRLGCNFDDAFDFIEAIYRMDNIELAGVYSHLALADISFSEYASQQTERQKLDFQRIGLVLKSQNPNLCIHLANSAGTILDPSFHYDMVRVGLVLYGCSPFVSGAPQWDLKPALSVKAKVTFLRDVQEGVGVSYGHHYVTSRPSQLAVIGIGYADGINRALSGKISAIFKGNFLPQVGAITMDQLIVDVTSVPQIKLGDTVTLLGEEQNKSITLREWSEKSDIIPWEILCGFRNRLPRVII
tara:strand:+ start:191 stop:1351 length:1161 start_codon:yes stop_codon:yes gene_type:complete